MDERRIDKYWEYENSDTGVFCGIWGVIAIFLATYFWAGGEDGRLPGMVSLFIGILLLLLCIVWTIRYAFLKHEYDQ